MDGTETVPVGRNGGASPQGIGHKKLGMWLFILSDSLTFAALLLSYAYLRAASEVWPAPFSLLPEVLFSTLMTLCLLASSLTMVRAVSASLQGNRTSMVKWMAITIAAGLLFIGLHLIEWSRLIGEGLRPFRIPATWGENASPLFGATFFTITGFHLLHVLSGVIYLSVTAARRTATREDIKICGMYWQFVDAVWLIIFPAIYLFSMK